MSINKPLKEDMMQQVILAAAKKLFQVHGLHKVTMDDVGKAIGKGRSSIYYYYKSKDEIFDAVVNIDIKDMKATISAAVDKAVTTEQKIYAFCITKLNVSREKRSFYNTLDMGMDADAVAHFNKIKVVHHNLIMKQESDLLNKILTGGIKSGALKSMSKKEKDTFIFVILSSLRGLKREMMLMDNYDNTEQVVGMLTRMAVSGLTQ